MARADAYAALKGLEGWLATLVVGQGQVAGAKAETQEGSDARQQTESWPSTRPIALAALLRKSPGEDQERADEVELHQMQAAAVSWTDQATLQAVLDALGHLGMSGDPAVFQSLLGAAKQKATVLEEHNASLGGGGLRNAIEAQRRAEEKAVAAEAQEKRHVIQWKEEFRAKVGALIADPLPEVCGAEARLAAAGS